MGIIIIFDFMSSFTGGEGAGHREKEIVSGPGSSGKRGCEGGAEGEAGSALAAF